MLEKFVAALSKKKENSLDRKEDIALLLKTTPEALEAFEKAYERVTEEDTSDNFIDVNAKQAAEMHAGVPKGTDYPIDALINRIVQELLSDVPIWSYDGKHVSSSDGLKEKIKSPVTNEELRKLPKEIRPQLTGTLMQRDIGEPAYLTLMDIYQIYLKESNPRKKQLLYHNFRQGMDLLDLDDVLYGMLGMNPNAMGYWLPRMIDNVLEQGFFHVPKTTIFKVPLPMLQLSRLNYAGLTRTTLDIVDKFVYKICHLKEDQSYFIKTGTFSSKFDFRNAKVTTPKEVRELGEYLLFISNYASMMAAPTNNVCIYGVSTTNEWVVREFIEDEEQNPTIYHGLPLHTEYRVFVDFDTKEILGINPYWDPAVMKQRLGHESDANEPDKVHDYVIYQMHEETLIKRYQEGKDKVLASIQDILEVNTTMNGQWAIDIMQNGNKFWLIDMALAQNSALKECIPVGKLKPIQENWIPSFENCHNAEKK